MKMTIVPVGFAFACALSMALPLTVAAQQEVYPVPDVHGAISKNEILGTSEAGFIVGGEFARVMFELMKSQPVQDPCGEGVIKQDNGGMQCHRSTDGFTQCSFGYDFDLKVLTAGPLIC